MDIINKYNTIIEELNNINMNNVFLNLIEENNNLKIFNNTLSNENINLKLENNKLLNENIKLNDDIENFNKVSVLQSINKQLNDKINYINILEKQLLFYKNKNKEENVKEEIIKEEIIKEAIIKEAIINEAIIKEENVKEENIKEENVKEENKKMKINMNNFELIEYKDNKYYKEISTNLIYNIKKNKPNIVVGKVRSSGKIKLN